MRERLQGVDFACVKDACEMDNTYFARQVLAKVGFMTGDAIRIFRHHHRQPCPGLFVLPLEKGGHIDKTVLPDR